MLKPVLVTAPATKLLTIDDVKLHSKIDYDDEDALIVAMIDAVISHLDGYSGILGRALIDQTWRQDFSRFGERMTLPIGPVSTIVNVKYYDADNIQQTLASSDYMLITDSTGPFITLASDKSWPNVYSRLDAVSVTFVAGYGSSASDVPASIIQAARMLVSTWLENRENVVVGVSVNEMPTSVGANALLEQFKRTWIV